LLGPAAGFEWEDSDMDGERSVALRRAARLGDADARAMLLRYNEDDCRATRAVREFLAAQAPGVPELLA
ncbi:ribonuclease H-like domain-containing protein, partial [Mycobacterium tuberculosis]